MTDEQRAMLDALSRCTFGAGSFDKRFVRDMAPRDALYELSARQDWYLRRTYYRYRKQIGHACKKPSDFDTPPMVTHKKANGESAVRPVGLLGVTKKRSEDLQKLRDWNEGKPL